MSHLSVGKVKSASVRYRYLLLFGAVFGGSLLLLSISNHAEILLLSSAPAASSWFLRRYEIAGSDETFTIKTEGCTIPGLRPFDEAIERFISRPRNPKQCSNTSDSLLENNDTHMWINTDMFQYYDIPRDDNVTCCYNSFFRPSAVIDSSTVYIDDRVSYQPCLYFSDYIEIANEFVRVACFSDYRILYEQFFVFPSKNPVLSVRENLTEAQKSKRSYNVIIVGIDAVSRLNFHRTMPKTLKYLKKKGAVELLGYNKVGDNTFPNLTPMLLGIKDTDLRLTCWPDTEATFDGCPFIWKWFKDAGYYTALGEDTANLGTFNYLRIGFNGTPTDFYLHTFMHEAENHVGNNKRLNTFLCMGDKYFYKVLLQYVESLAVTLKSSKLFGFFWEVTMSHDFLNYPMLMDDSYESFLKKLDDIKYLDDTILILLSDHGIRWGDIRMTKQGRLEERLPFVHIMVPPSFRESYTLAYDNLKLNSKRLTTPFDIYSTLLDLVDLKSIENERLKARIASSYADRRSISLFLPIPGNRTCEAAAIEDQWCTCHSGKKLPIDNKESQEASAQLVSHLNSLLQDYRQCAKLRLGEILEVTEMVAGTPRENEVGWREFMAVVRTQPGGGVFEGTLRHARGRWALAGAASRLNLYGNQSRCIHHYELKLYCFCPYMGHVAGSATTKIKTMKMVKFKYLFLAAILLVAGFSFFTSINGIYMFFNHDEAQRINIDSRVSIQHSERSFTIDTEGCTIPALEPLDANIRQFVKYPFKIPKCPDENKALLGNDGFRIWIRKITYQHYKINKTDEVSCCYRSFYRPTAVDDIESKKIDDRSIYSTCIFFNDVIEVNDEFVHVTCYNLQRKIIYEQYFLFATTKTFMQHGNTAEIIANHNKTTYNVVVLGIDAVSRLNFHRTMPNTANYLRKNGAVEFLGYNKVGDNTFPNLVPMLLGIKETELKKTCYPYDASTFDNCPFIWEWFKQAGYYTALGEDASNLGTFNYEKRGFSITPTDYYLHTFMTEAIKYVGAQKDFNSYLCMHDMYFYKVLLNYIEELTWRLANKRLFGFFWEVSMSHDYLNYPMKMDDDYLNLFSNWETSGYLNETIVIFVSDHGIRWGDIRNTKQGRLEERLPFLYILTPKTFRDTYIEAYSNLKINSKRLITPFDVHATLFDLVDLKNLEKDELAKRSSNSFADKRSISLFLPVPETRNCKMADIDDHWCTCHKEIAVAKDDPQAIDAAKTLVHLINTMLIDYPQCANLAMADVVEVTEIIAGEENPGEETWTEFMVVVKTNPGGGKFEATLRQDEFDESWQLLGTPSRLNLYGDQSRCVDHYQMKLYCYCS